MGEALDVLHGLVLDSPSGARWGEVATGWQRADAAAVLEPGDGARLHWLGRPKGASKSTDVAAMLCAWATTQAEPLATAYVFSADLDQSNRLLHRARVIISRTAALASLLRVEARRIVHVRSQASVEALPADAAGNEGILTPLIVLEELPNWSVTPAARKVLTVALSSVPKLPGGRLVVIGHAGDPAHYAHKLLAQAKASPRWRVVEVPGPTPWISPGDLDEQRALLLPSEFARRWLNRWTAGEDRLTTREDLAACVTLPGPGDSVAGVRYVVSLDMGFVRDAAVAAVMHADAGRVVLDRLQVWKGSRQRPVSEAAVEAWLLQAHREFSGALVRLDPWQTKGLAQRLRAGGVRTEEFAFTAQSVGRLALTLYRLIREHRLAIFDDEDLVDELANVQLRQGAPGVYRMDHASGGHDDRAVAVALAADWLQGRAPLGAPSAMGAALLAEANLLPWGRS